MPEISPWTLFSFATHAILLVFVGPGRYQITVSRTDHLDWPLAVATRRVLVSHIRKHAFRPAQATKNMSTSTRPVASASTNGAPVEQSYFEQQREILVGEIAQVSNGATQHILTIGTRLTSEFLEPRECSTQH